MTYEQVMTELFEFSAPTYYKWNKHQRRKIFLLIEKYFTKNDLQEFLVTGKIQELDDFKNFKNSDCFSEYSLFKEFLEFKKTKDLK